MDFAVDYFKDEVRNGFYIPTAIKQAWAANLSVISEIDRICKKYGIRYFADWGSMLGAVRHGGYVPWDDDLDICMLREDYNRFRDVADKELPEEFAIHDFRSKEDHWLFLARVVNSNQISFDEEHLKKYHNFPYISVVDIFIKDYLYRDEDKETERCKEIKKLIAVADGIVENSFSKETISWELTEIEKKYRVKIDRSLSPRDIGILIYGLAEKQMACVKEEEADNIGQMFPMVLKGDRGLPKEYYDDEVRIPFENTTIPVPARYNELLKNRYGNYLEIHKVWVGHNYPYFEGQRKNLQEVADFTLPEFTFKPEMLNSCDRECGKNDSLVGMSRDFLEQLKSLNESMIGLFEEGLYGEVIDIMPDVQQFVVDYATLVENVKGEKRDSTKRVVEAIQEYCDVLYGIYLYLNEKNVSDTSAGDGDLQKRFIDAHYNIVDAVNDNVINKKEVLFLPIGEKEWTVFNNIYRTFIDNDGYDVFVVPIPIFFKDIYGRVTASEDEISGAIDYGKYPKYLVTDSWMNYNLQLHRPDVIYIQNPYDGENPCLTVPPQFYARNLRQFTNSLIYIPPFVTGEFGPEDYNDIYNLKHYVNAPGVIYADEVIVQSENIREQYINKLSGFAGEDTRIIWQSKIKDNKTCVDFCIDDNIGKSLLENDRIINKRKKKLLYCVGLNEVAENRNTLIEQVKQKMSVFEENSDSIDVDIFMFPTDYNLWMKRDSEVTQRLLCLFKEYRQNELIIFDHIDKNNYQGIVDSYDAYYGSASPLVPLFSQCKKPIMIANYNV